tara:strand:- start:50581 stop:51153 length:573 start_codon:yes stop_codon:yes gene_type:complete
MIMRFKNEAELAKALGISEDKLQSRISSGGPKKRVSEKPKVSQARKKLQELSAVNISLLPPKEPQVILFRALVRKYGSYWSRGEMVYELRRVIPGRRFELDMAMPCYKIGIEMDGYRNHGLSKSGFNRDRKKWVEFQKVGWMVIPISPEQVREDLVGTIESIDKCLRERAYVPTRVEMKDAVVGCVLVKD